MTYLQKEAELMKGIEDLQKAQAARKMPADSSAQKESAKIQNGGNDSDNGHQSKSGFKDLTKDARNPKKQSKPEQASNTPKEPSVKVGQRHAHIPASGYEEPGRRGCSKEYVDFMRQWLNSWELNRLNDALDNVSRLSRQTGPWTGVVPEKFRVYWSAIEHSNTMIHRICRLAEMRCPPPPG